MLGAMALPEEVLDNVFDLLTFTSSDGREIAFVDLPGTRALQTGETVRAEEVVVHLPNGNSMTTLINCAPLFSESGEIVSVMSVMQDMTPWKTWNDSELNSWEW